MWNQTIYTLLKFHLKFSDQWRNLPVSEDLVFSSWILRQFHYVFCRLYIKQPPSRTSIADYDAEPEWTEYKIKEINMFTADKYQQVIRTRHSAVEFPVYYALFSNEQIRLVRRSDSSQKRRHFLWGTKPLGCWTQSFERACLEKMTLVKNLPG